jgi:hypothetical protein
VAKRLQLHNVIKTREQCRYKFANLKRSYFNAVKVQNIQYLKHKKHGYWQELDEIFGNETNRCSVMLQRPKKKEEPNVEIPAEICLSAIKEEKID